MTISIAETMIEDQIFCPHTSHMILNKHIFYSPQKQFTGASCEEPYAKAISTKSSTPRIGVARIVKPWCPEEESLLISFYGYFRNSWSLYRPYFNRTASSIKMKYYSISKAHKLSTHNNLSPPLMDYEAYNLMERSSCLADRWEAIQYLDKLETVAAGDPALALQLMRICGTVSELNHFIVETLNKIEESNLINILISIPPLDSGGAPAGFGASLKFLAPNNNSGLCYNLQYNINTQNSPYKRYKHLGTDLFGLR